MMYIEMDRRRCLMIQVDSRGSLESGGKETTPYYGLYSMFVHLWHL